MEAHPRCLPPGTYLAQRYVIGRVLGVGGFGVTYLGVDWTDGRRVAIKEHLPRDSAMRAADRVSVEPFSTAEAPAFRAGLARFVEEGQVLTRFAGHPNIVRVIAAFEAHGTGYLVMDYIGGLPLDQMRENSGGRLGQSEVIPIALQLLDALGAIHGQSWLHRDVKPANIYLGDDGAVKLLDFGAARYATGHASQTLSQLLTPGFAPLEQYQQRGRQGPATDLYAVGATLYLLLTGHAPPDATERALGAPLTPLHLVPGCDASDAVSAVIDRALRMPVNERWGSAREMRDALVRAADPSWRRTAPAGPIAAPVATAPAAPLALPQPSAAAAPSSQASKLLGGIAITGLAVLWLGSQLLGSDGAGSKDCPAGTTLDDGKCVPEVVKKCPPGMRFRSGKGCVPSVVSPPATPTPTSPPTPTNRPTLPGPTMPTSLPDVPRPLEPISPLSPHTPPAPSVVPDGPLVCPRGMARIPGGAFEPGGSKARVEVAPFCMDRTEVTVEAYAACVRRGGCTENVASLYAGGKTFGQGWCNWGVAGRESHPINCVDWSAADTYCRLQNKRLPTEEEWEWAARGGPAARTYPWGSTEPTSRSACHFESKSSGTCAVGSHPAGRSLHGLEDMAGNVEEWTSGSASTYRVLRGGSYLAKPLQLRVSDRGLAAPGNRHSHQGFRCAR